MTTASTKGPTVVAMLNGGLVEVFGSAGMLTGPGGGGAAGRGGRLKEMVPAGPT